MIIFDLLRSIFVENWDKSIPIILSLLALIISIKSWVKSRSIYGVETYVLRQTTGNKDDIENGDKKMINHKLSSGEYTILSVQERTKSDNDWELILGRIKK